jgi:hypothetical protein
MARPRNWGPGELSGGGGRGIVLESSWTCVQVHGTQWYCCACITLNEKMILA